MQALSRLLPVMYWTGSSMEWFDVTDYQEPTQCERMQCLSVRLEHCRDHLEGFYLREKGCPSGKQCTDCTHGNSTTPAICYCESPPYTTSVGYGQNCGMGKTCEEGICFRPCHTFLHLTSCPGDYCKWVSETKECQDKLKVPENVYWMRTQDGPIRSPVVEMTDVIMQTSESAFPMSFQYFRYTALGYRIEGMLIDSLINFVDLFLELDSDNTGDLSSAEFARLPEVMSRLEVQVLRQIDDGTLPDGVQISTASEANFSFSEEDSSAGRRLYAAPNATVTPEKCAAKRPREYFCSFDMSCKRDCGECGWKSATDSAFSKCVKPSPHACHADGHKVFCESDQLCHAPGECNNCVDRPVVDHEQHSCLAVWWDPHPLKQMKNWVCRHRNKNGMPCKFDQDCIHGLKRCLNNKCQPFQPYNLYQTCTTDLDCHHIGYFCPSDPTGGKNKYWVQYCRPQAEEGMTCEADRDCKPDMRCNTREPQARCRRLFSLPVGEYAEHDYLCQSGWTGRNFKCAPPAKSKQMARPCDTSADCTTTDGSGRTGECVCKQWWEYQDSKYCDPVTGDYRNHHMHLRNYLFFRAENCGTFWTEDECLRVHGNKALRLKLEVECERQTLVGGAYLPDADCGLGIDDRFRDPCAQKDALN